MGTILEELIGAAVVGRRGTETMEPVAAGPGTADAEETGLGAVDAVERLADTGEDPSATGEAKVEVVMGVVSVTLVTSVDDEVETDMIDRKKKKKSLSFKY